MNAAPPEVIAAVVSDPAEAQRIEQCRNPANGGTPVQNAQPDLAACGVTDPNISKFRGQGQWFEVIAKVEYGTSMFMASAELNNTGGGNGRLSKVKTFRMY